MPKLISTSKADWALSLLDDFDRDLKRYKYDTVQIRYEYDSATELGCICNVNQEEFIEVKVSRKLKLKVKLTFKSATVEDAVFILFTN